ncbi:MAG: hypothetical protein C0609_08595 [Deltaproteobacteria bacterium]|nr:MAG: hypothetical protein C0609_08595 [Deltaproteobacteria bacterium]
MKKAALIIFIFISTFFSSPSLAVTNIPAGKISDDSSWEGELHVEGLVTVEEGASLKIAPGSKVFFGTDGKLEILGGLIAKGEDGAPISFLASRGVSRWKGIKVSGEKALLKLERVSVSDYEDFILTGLNGEIIDSTLKGGVTGLRFMMKGVSVFSGNIIEDMEKSGIEATLGASPLVQGNIFKDCGEVGIYKGQNAFPLIQGNLIEGTKRGIFLVGDTAPVFDNVIKGGLIGIGISQATGEMVVGHNNISSAEKAILCTQFSSPVIESNVIRGSKVGIECFQSSSPRIAHNNLENNDTALNCNQLCEPEVVGNKISGNKVAIFLEASSYAQIKGNDLGGNAVVIKLGDMMSSDWESSASSKQRRSRQARNENLVNKGRQVPQEYDDDTPEEVSVAAGGNWWGEEVTAKLEELGPEGQVPEIEDGYDEPLKSYPGWEGEFKLDKVVYAPWLTEPPEGAGPFEKGASKWEERVVGRLLEKGFSRKEPPKIP